MRIEVLAISRRTPAWAREATDEYLGRLKPALTVKMLDLAPGRRSQAEPRPQVLRAEAARFRSALSGDRYTVALDEKGRALDTRAFAAKLRDWRDAATPVAFLIGGADGLDATLLREADECWSLSALTLPHTLARVVLVEQLYRAWSILNNHPYHRE